MAESAKHETVMDVTAERLAHVYAQAFWGAALKQGDPAAAIDELRSVVTEALDKYPGFETILGSALVAPEEKKQLIDKVFGKQLSTTVLNFLKVLSAHDRLELLRLVVKEAKGFLREHLGQVEVDVRVAAPMTSELEGELMERLRKRAGTKEPILKITVDPEIVGGIIVKVGDRVYDGSLRTRFEMAKRAIIERASDLIETKPDLFVLADA
jgi:F-type H+-transporting ATPase subunit delta